MLYYIAIVTGQKYDFTLRFVDFRDFAVTGRSKKDLLENAKAKLDGRINGLRIAGAIPPRPTTVDEVLSSPKVRSLLSDNGRLVYVPVKKDYRYAVMSPTPIHPGVILRETVVKDMRLSVKKVAKKMGMPYLHVMRILHGKSPITHEFSRCFCTAFGGNSAELQNRQIAYDESVGAMS